MGLDPSANIRRTVPAPHSQRALETSQLFSSGVAHGLDLYYLSGMCPARHTGLSMNKRCFSGRWYPFLPSHSPWESHLVLSPGITLSCESVPCQHMPTDAVLFSASQRVPSPKGCTPACLPGTVVALLTPWFSLSRYLSSPIWTPKKKTLPHSGRHPASSLVQWRCPHTLGDGTSSLTAVPAALFSFRRELRQGLL